MVDEAQDCILLMHISMPYPKGIGDLTNSNVPVSSGATVKSLPSVNSMFPFQTAIVIRG